MGDITFSPGAIAVITLLVASLASTILGLFKLLLISKDKELESSAKTLGERIKDLEDERDTYRSAAKDAAQMLEASVVELRKSRGDVPVAKIAPVKPEHNSPVTEQQARDAELATLRASLAASALALGVEVGSNNSSSNSSNSSSDEEEEEEEEGDDADAAALTTAAKEAAMAAEAAAMAATEAAAKAIAAATEAAAAAEATATAAATVVAVVKKEEEEREKAAITS